MGNGDDTASQRDLNGLGDRVNDLREKVAVTESKISGLGDNAGHIWEAIDKIKDDGADIRKELTLQINKLSDGLNRLKIDYAKISGIIGIAVVIINALIVKALMH